MSQARSGDLSVHGLVGYKAVARLDLRLVCLGMWYILLGGLVRDGRAEPEADSVQVHKRKEERPGCIWLG